MLTWVSAFKKSGTFQIFICKSSYSTINLNILHILNLKASTLHFSDILANTIQLGSRVEKPFSSKLEEEAWENMGISKKISLFDLKQKIHETWDETVSLFLQAN